MAEEGNGEAGSIQGFRRAVDRWGGRGGRGGAFERIGEARGWRWPRGSSSVAAAPFGRVRERGSRGGGRVRESEGVPGVWRGTHGGVRGVEVERQAGGGRGVRRRASATRLCLLARGGRRQGGEVEMGWAVLLGQVGYQVSAR